MAKSNASGVDPVPSPREIFAQGHQARENGLPRAANPHPPGSTEFAAWDEGWIGVERPPEDHPIVEAPTG